MAYPAIGTKEYNEVKEQMLKEFRVTPTEQFNVKVAIRGRIDYLKNYLRNSGMKAYVLGISGGVDSTTVGRLAQLACEELRAEGYMAQFIAVRLPAGIQKDEADAQAAIKFINADKTITVNIGEAANNLNFQGLQQFVALEGAAPKPEISDFHKGNIKARLRMVSQYHVAALYNGLVLETSNQNEIISGFFTKWGDGSADLSVINGINKRQVRLCAKELGAPEFLWSKAATADLEELAPAKLDEDALGFPYDALDDFLEGKEVSVDVEGKIVRQYLVTQHKRAGISQYS